MLSLIFQFASKLRFRSTAGDKPMSRNILK